VVTASVKKIPFGPSLKELLDPSSLAVVHREPRHIGAAEIRFNELSGEPETLRISEEKEAAIPMGAMAEKPWRRELVGYNTRLIARQHLYNVLAPPAIEGGLHLVAGILDLVTLGLLGFRDDARIKAAAKEIADIYGYNWFDTRKRYFVYGVPERRPGAQRVTIERGGSLPGDYTRMGFDDYQLRDYGGPFARTYRKASLRPSRN